MTPGERAVFEECLRAGPSSPNVRALFHLQFAAGPLAVSKENLPDVRRVLTSLYEPRSQRALERFKTPVDELTFGPVPAMRIHPPQGVKPSATLLYFFGGGHITGTPQQDFPISAALAAYGGLKVISPSYRLAPEHPFPAALDDALAVYRAVLDTTGPENLFLAGESAGGNLALALVQRLQSLGLPLPAKMALLSPWCNLAADNPYGGEPQEFDPTINMDNLHAAAAFYAGGADTSQPEISPVFGSFPKHFPEIMITTGSRDRMLFDILTLVVSMRQSGLAPRLEIWPDMSHVFEFYDEIPEAELSLRDIAAFLCGKGTP